MDTGEKVNLIELELPRGRALFYFNAAIKQGRNSLIESKHISELAGDTDMSTMLSDVLNCIDGFLTVIKDITVAECLEFRDANPTP